MSAARSRERKIAYTRSLEEDVARLTAENEALTAKVAELEAAAGRNGVAAQAAL